MPDTEGLNLTLLLVELILLADLCIRVGLAVRVIMRRRPVGVTLAWLALVLGFPLMGAVAYLLFGELRLGHRRALRAERIHEPYERWLAELRGRADVDWEATCHDGEPLARLSEAAIGIPALPGNHLKLLADWESAFASIVQDIDEAKRTCHLEFYIWHAGGWADEVAAALKRAAARGVTCRVLLDDVGSRDFLRSVAVGELRDAGVEVQAALPASLLRMVFVRFDLRMHRKIVVIDGRISYTGSMNLVDPRYFKQDAGVGQWVDAMVRMEGPAVEAMAITFLEDWTLESPDDIDRLRETGDVHPMRPRGEAPVQVLPSGPAQNSDAIERILLAAIYQARSELILTTPYFVPNEAILMALISAAERGVEVTLIVPARVDSLLVRWASQAFKGDLANAGVRILLYEGGLLHTKSVTIDGRMALFGSLNLDPRSLFLNFEITIAIYDAAVTRELRAVQLSYAEKARTMDVQEWLDRKVVTRFLENTARLAGPLL